MPYFGFVSPIRVKNGSTDFTIASSTGGLYQENVALPHSSQLNPLATVTWPTTGAQTLANTTSVQSLTNKTVNNITITDPGSSATLTISSGGTLEAIGAFQHKFTSTANSAVTIPPATDALLMWTTEVDGKITAKTSQINVLGVVTWPTTAAQTLANTTSIQTFENKTIGTGCVFFTTDSTGAATIPNYGLTRIAASASASTYLMAAPSPGVMKFLYVAANSTAITIDASTAVEIGVLGTTDAYRKIVWTRPGTVQLLGITTAQWDVLSVGTTFVGTTALPTFTT